MALVAKDFQHQTQWALVAILAPILFCLSFCRSGQSQPQPINTTCLPSATGPLAATYCAMASSLVAVSYSQLQMTTNPANPAEDCCSNDSMRCLTLGKMFSDGFRYHSLNYSKAFQDTLAAADSSPCSHRVVASIIICNSPVSGLAGSISV